MTDHEDEHDFDPAAAFERLGLNSPEKPQAERQNVQYQNENENSFHRNARKQLSLSQLPPLPPMDDDDLHFEDGEEERSEGHMDTVDEDQMRRHLNDVESSFLPEPSQIGQHQVEETYSFESPVRSAQSKLAIQNGRANGFTTPEQARLPLPPIDEAESSFMASEQSPCAGRELTRTEERKGSVDSTSMLESMSSSPTAAAAARTVSRVLSMASMGYDVEGHEIGTYTENTSQHDNSDDDKENTTPHKNEAEQFDGNDEQSDDERSTVRHHLSQEELNAADAGRTPGHALTRKASGRRPKFLRSRMSSQRSSQSSANIDANDESFETDYAMLTGGAAPTETFSRQASQAMSRTISLGSIASGIEDSELPTPNNERALATLTEEERNMDSTDIKSESEAATDFLATPKANNRALAPPTDTVIARHVRNVQVPESVAKEYRNKTVKSWAAQSVPGGNNQLVERQGKNLTLKEQSSTIERLSKENFDLKLKVMFLSERIKSMTEEGAKDLSFENVELRTVLTNLQRDNKALRKKVRELEKANNDDSQRPSTARSGTSSDDPRPQWFDHEGNREREEELIYLRERIEEYEVQIEKMRNENFNREAEKRNLAEIVKNMGQKRGEDMEAREEMDVWKDLLEQETARREQSDEDNRRLREEIFKLRSETALTQSQSQHQQHPIPGMNHTTNIYNITKKRQVSPSRSSRMSELGDDRSGQVLSAASTLVEELRNESERLRHENAELRREVGAQTSMLTSRNREKERLYQEIEDLKLGHRKGGSVAGDSILDRSASRAGQRPISRGSAMTRQTLAIEDDEEREDLENKNNELRDNLNALKLANQELQKELDSCMEDFETAIESKRQAEALAAEYQAELQAAEHDLVSMQTERDEALRGQEDVETEFESLRKEAQEEIDALEAEAEQRTVDIESLQLDLANMTESFNALKQEMREMSEAVIRLEDDQDIKTKKIKELEEEVNTSNNELDEMDKALNEAREKINRLNVQLESHQGEIAFLREEQDADKIKIGDLESALKVSEIALSEEKERVKELEQRIANERHQRDLIAGQEKQEVQKYINDLNREASGAKDESRRLRKSLASREAECKDWKHKLLELEGGLGEALGDLKGTRSSFLKSINDLQRQLDETSKELLATRDSILEKDRLIKQRDNLLETHGLESRKLADMLEKERQAHRSTKHQHEASLQNVHHTSRTVSQQESRVMQLEHALSSDRKKLSQLEATFKETMLERNNLLLAMWNRLSALCGSDWAHNNNLINGRALPTLEAITNMFSGFSKNLIAAVKQVENIIAGFKGKFKGMEKSLMKEYTQLEATLDSRTRRLERIEAAVKNQALNGPSEQKSEVARLQNVNRLLRAELAANRNNTPRKSIGHGMVGDRGDGSPSPTVPMGPGGFKRSVSGLSRSFSNTSADAHLNTSIPLPPMLVRTSSQSTQRSVSGPHSGQGQSNLPQPSSSSSSKSKSPRNRSRSPGFARSQLEFKPEKGSLRRGLDESMPSGLSAEEQWEWRMQEMERRLREEREGRRLDRKNAKVRLEEEQRRNREIEEERRRREGRDARREREREAGRDGVGY